MSKVVIYTTPTCTYCDSAKRFFKENGVEYTEHNVKSDLEKRAEMQALSGKLSVPVITIDGRVFEGFNGYVIKEALGI